MTEYKDLQIINNGEEISYTEVQHIASKRAAHILEEMSGLGATLYLNDTELDSNQIYTLSNMDLLQACIESKKKWRIL
ncbi:hypothetical protein [Companilactobacillus futsaii]|uniref:Uncharacterized protein n=2 Tax=Companilactobacillus futsaii TaxID=938155 RepID=A0A5B7T2P0_9LACO|nr:hypothetical protein [Companilactobacillus futsaii]KRK91891.1 hypothetical protein FC88_GL001019 [Companilactobacillus futsaii JCM 17355]QCX24774.1 hypothetical protein FG051_06470 [Companilactobacillus futsaii]